MSAQAASQYISASRWRCVAGAWLRELGFVACYGSVVLRLWVLLAEFRTRKAHRWTPRDSEVLAQGIVYARGWRVGFVARYGFVVTAYAGRRTTGRSALERTTVDHKCSQCVRLGRWL